MEGTIMDPEEMIAKGMMLASVLVWITFYILCKQYG